MNSQSENLQSSSGRFFQTVQPLRDLQSNWTVDLAKNLEEYLLKICSGEISGGDDDALISVNFAEAALLLQGSVQVYSRKVEYLYSLVLHALEFISQKSQEDQAASASALKEATGVHTAKDEDDSFWGLDNIPVEAKTLLDTATCKDVLPSHFVRPPANLVVLEGECLDASGEAGELESYLLATNDLYRNFILLDACDAVAVDDFLDRKASQGPSYVYRGSSMTSKGHKSFLSPSRRSGGTCHKLSVGKKQDANLPKSPIANLFESNECHMQSSPPAFDCSADDIGFGTEHMDNSDGDDDDPWKPLNPHGQGNLKVKPYKKVKANKRVGVGTRKHLSISAEFPLAKLRGPISTELTEIWEAKFGASENHDESRPRTLYEKLRESLIAGERKTNNAFYNHDDDAEDNGYDSGDPDTEPPEFHKPENAFSKEDVPPNLDKHDGGGNHFQDNDPCDGSDAHANLEDLCRSHLDALLATLAETDKQNELASRVSTWKQRIEQNLEEQDARPPFDIHKYGERVLEKLCVAGDNKEALPFGDVVRGQEKHDVARTFSAMLQLVNNGDIDLVRSSTNSTSTCHSDVNPFYIRLLKNERQSKGVTLQSSKKRVKSPLVKGCAKAKTNKGKENYPVLNSSPPESSSGFKFSVNAGKASGARCTPEGKKRRKSRLVAPLNMHFAG
ncbi:hypothetical protein BUALT_Bualt14G0061200 [Buddleja alternifolia]|uniref:Condensin-2 complex subunit H2 n=1 Tax=Buddleja alternifolia TaxID=168488 RepID=A0AAV6WN86_9LAMI|nr:hypothetical protein BUALT_Bualt14G0061200 [Buddleja alternifolia]